MAKKKKQLTPTGAQARPPIVTVMGHVDHGKTSLLDYIRKSRVVAKEAGGITQHIGAYQVAVPGEKKDPEKLITFIDTPGHAAFEKMRSRGGQAADIVVLVISATEGIKPQTKESIQHIQSAKVPYIIALNKVDLPEANPEKIKNELTAEGIITEDRGGEIIAVPVSAITGKGIDDLLESILLVSEMEELTADPGADVSAMIIESHLDQRRGPLATAIVTSGTLRLKDEIQAGEVTGKVKALFNDIGKGVNQAPPSYPVQILGLNNVPPVGSIVTKLGAQTASAEATDSIHVNSKGKALLKLILRADVSGSLEAIVHSLPSEVQVLSAEVGDITENDVLTAKTGTAQIVGFNVKASSNIDHLAESEGVNVHTFSIIYELLEHLKDQIMRATDPYYDRDIVGRANVKAVFQIDKRRICGGQVTEGELTEGVHVDILRNDRQVGSSRISSLQQGKDSTKRVGLGDEFGAVLSPYVDFRAGDAIIAHKPKSK